MADGYPMALRAYQAELRPGERFAPYSHDAACCDCDPVVEHILPCIPVAVGTAPDGTAYDRCMVCGQCWTRKRYRDSPATFLADPGVSVGAPGSGGYGPSEQAYEIAARLEAGERRVDIAAELGVTVWTVNAARRAVKKAAGR